MCKGVEKRRVKGYQLECGLGKLVCERKERNKGEEGRKKQGKWRKGGGTKHGRGKAK
jgi:hypothetical protein